MKNKMEKRTKELIIELMNDDKFMFSEEERFARVTAMLIAGNLVGLDVEEMNLIAKDLATKYGGIQGIWGNA